MTAVGRPHALPDDLLVQLYHSTRTPREIRHAFGISTDTLYANWRRLRDAGLLPTTARYRKCYHSKPSSAEPDDDPSFAGDNGWFAARDATNALLDALKREHGPDGRPDLAV